VASALALAPRTTAGLTITINGTCIEAVDQVPGNVTLQGMSSGDGLQAPDTSSNPVLGISGAGVTLDNLTISGGVNALLVRNGATAVGNNVVIEGSSSRNVWAKGVLTFEFLDYRELERRRDRRALGRYRVPPWRNGPEQLSGGFGRVRLLPRR
jgi:hypothetical protein